MHDMALAAGAAMTPLPRPRPERAPLLADLVRRLSLAPLPGGDLVSVTLSVPDLARLPFHVPDGLADCWSWARPGDRLGLLAAGSALRIERPDCAALDSALRALDWGHHDPDQGGGQPVVFLGHGFGGGGDPAGLPAALARVPLVALRRRAERAELIFSHAGDTPPALIRARWADELARLVSALDAPPPALAPLALARLDEQPDGQAFRARVAAATRAIQAGRVEKVVLSRRIRVGGSRPFLAGRLAGALAARHPSCAIFTAAFGARVLVAASPERLVACAGRRVDSYALAGTAPVDPQDPFLGGRLLSGHKDRHEHRLVVEWIARALGDLCHDLDVPAEPRRMTLGQLEHLWTPISGHLRPGAGLLAAAARLHPTPAVAGLPLAAARALLDDLGESRLGWYTGAFGWIDRAGDGEMAVVLRCALLDGSHAWLSAGGGIVAESEPEAEFAETELKLRTMLDALQEA